MTPDSRGGHAGLLVAGAAPALADCYYNGQQVAGVCRFGVRAHPDAPRQSMSVWNAYGFRMGVFGLVIDDVCFR